MESLQVQLKELFSSSHFSLTYLSKITQKYIPLADTHYRNIGLG